MRTERTPRRTPVKGRQNIYYRTGADGRRKYEISYLDSDGTPRWKTTGSSLDDAQAALDEVRTRLRRGERIAPTKMTFADATEAWLLTKGQLSPRTRLMYAESLDRHAVPRLGTRRISDVSDDDVARLIADMQSAGYAGWTIRGVLTPLRQVMAYAVRRGAIASNPVDRLERGERPKVSNREMRFLARSEIDALLNASTPLYRPIIATGVFTGLRIGELLGLTWDDIDFDAGVVNIRKQIDRATGKRVTPKTSRSQRQVVLMPALGGLLRRHRLASPHSLGGDFAFASVSGRPLHYRNVVRRGLDTAAHKADLNPPGIEKLRFHDLRHTYASLLISEGLNVVFVSRQLGHASPDITLRVYAHLFDRQEHAAKASAALERGFGEVLS